MIYNQAIRKYKKIVYDLFKNNCYDVCFLILIVIALCIKVWKAKYGISEYDEAFYLTIPHRMSLGDSLFLNEWHPSQMSGFLLYPLFCLYMFFFGTTEGIQLAFRYIYIVVHFLVVFFVYLKIRKNRFLTILGCVLYFLFTPFQLMALSYNTLGMDFILLTGVILATYKYNKKIDLLQLFFSGLFFAASVICCPYLVFAFFLYIFSICIQHILTRISKRKSKTIPIILQNDVFSIRSFVFFFLGCLSLAIVLFFYIFTHMNFTSFLDSVKYILTDPEHMPTSLVEKGIIYFQSLIISDNIIYISASLIFVVSFFVMLFDKKRTQHKSVYLFIACCYTIIFLLFSRKILFNAFIIPISFLGLFAFVLSKERKWNLFVFVYFLGLIYSFSLNCSSNTGIYAIGLAFSVPSFCSFIFLDDILYEYIKDIKETKNISNKILVLILSVTIISFSGFEIINTINYCLWDGNVIYPHQLTARIENGPLKGVITGVQRKNMYENIYSDLERIKTLEKKPILCLTNQAWLYLALENYEYATFSAWLPETDSTLLRLDEYYLMHTNKKPYYIYIPETGRWENLERPIKYFEAKGYVCKKYKLGYLLELD